jgi:hypothetical protein
MAKGASVRGGRGGGGPVRAGTKKLASRGTGVGGVARGASVGGPRRASVETKPSGRVETPDRLEELLDAARAHGEESEPDHEVGDLQGYLLSAWESYLTSPQRVQVYNAHATRRLRGADVASPGAMLGALPFDDVRGLSAVLRTVWRVMNPGQRQSLYREHAEEAGFWLHGGGGGARARGASGAGGRRASAGGAARGAVSGGRGGVRRR